MDWEAPIDAWYVWLAVSIVSLALGGIVLGLPAGPPPDATQAANTIERVTGSTDEASATYDHDATRVLIDGRTVSMENEHGTSHSSIAYEQAVPVMGNDRLEAIARGSSFEDAYRTQQNSDTRDATGVFFDHLATAHEENSGEWHQADGELTVRRISVEPDSVVAVSVRGSVEQGVSTTENPITELTVFSSAAAGTEMDVDITGTEFARHGYEPEYRHVTETVTTDESGAAEVDLLAGDDINFGDALVPLITVDVAVDSTECSGVIETEAAYDTVDLCPLGPTAEDVANDVEWITQDSRTGEFYVTLVTV